jgi:hypothetical protein
MIARPPSTAFRLSGAVSFALAVSCTLSSVPPAEAKTRLSRDAQESTGAAPVRDAYGALPISFELNQGQTDHRVAFLARGPGYTLFLTPREAVFALRGEHATALRMEFVGANPEARIGGESRLPGVSNYFIGNDQSKWRRDVPTYARVRYEGVYPGVNLVYYGSPGAAGTPDRSLEYDFEVAPGADPRQIALRFAGADGVAVEDGDLTLRAGGGRLTMRRPVAYQEAEPGSRRSGLPATAKRPVRCEYRIDAEGRVGFDLGAYDRAKPLVIDPVIAYSTFLGGTGFDWALGIAVSPHGSAFVTGMTTSAEFPLGQQPQQFGPGGGYDAFVAKLDAAGTTVLYSTYVGGTGDEDVYVPYGYGGIALNPVGEAFITGITQSSDFPAMNAAQPTPGGSADAFVARLDASGALTYATYLGGVGWDAGKAIALDSAGGVYVTGYDGSPDDFPLANALQPAFGGGPHDAFVTKLDPSQPPNFQKVYSTHFGGSGGDTGWGIAVDDLKQVYVTGVTTSPNFPGVNASSIQPSLKGPADAFVVRLNAAGSAVDYATYLGGNVGPDPASAVGEDYGYAVAVDSGRNAYVVGLTTSPDFPLKNPVQDTYNGYGDSFVTEINDAGTALVYSTYRGGPGLDYATGVAVDILGSAYVSGTSGGTFPITPNEPQCIDPGAFVMKLAPAGSSVVYATCLSGLGKDAAFGIAVDPAGCAYVTGRTQSYNFPTTKPLQAAHAGGEYDAFVTKICLGTLDHFKCYDVKASGFTPFTVILSDQFERQTVTVLRPVMLCNPAIKCVGGDCTGRLDPDGHLVAYETRDPNGGTHFEQREVIVSNQFGAQQRMTAWRRKNLLLVPSLKAHVGER